MEKWNELKQKFNEYFEIISEDHHKNCDRYLRLEIEHDALGNENSGEDYFEVIHEGYVHDFKFRGDTIEEAIDRALEKLDELIELERV